MLEYKPITENQYDELFELLKLDTSEYMQPSLETMQMTWDKFAGVFRTVGSIDVIYQDGCRAGFYWIEVRECTLHLHGLILEPAYQGQGIGSEVIRKLADHYRGCVDVMELGVHQSNARAKKLYEHLGFVEVNFLDGLGYSIMHLPI